LFVVFLFNQIIIAQEVHFPPILLSGIKNKVKVINIPNSIDTVNLITSNGEFKETFYAPVKQNQAEINVEVSKSGNYSFMLYESALPKFEKTVYPGWFSLVPPILAILLALIFRQVIVALFAGIYIGLLFVYDFNFITALLRLIDTNLYNALIDPDHAYIILFTLLIGGVVGIISNNGGTAGLANQITKFAKTARTGMIASWLMGIIIFFDDYANSLIIGNMMRPITDKLKISREKLAYIVDSTAAPVASLVIISTWIGYELGLIGEGLKIVGSNENPYHIFLQSVPFRFYPIGTIFFVFMTSYLNRDFGPMYKAEVKARKFGVSKDENFSDKIKDLEIVNHHKARWFNGAIPIAIILFGTVIGLFYTGIISLKAQGISEYGLQEIISNSDSYRSLLWASLIAGIVAVILTFGQKIKKLEDTIKDWQGGIQSMMVAVIILILAWGISSITRELNTADYLISILSNSIPPRLFPAIVFIACGFISFATGTSWGTMAIVMPIVIPMAAKISGIESFGADDSNLLILGVISSVLAGSVWGDHCSPIADTTILSSLASECNHINHVNTQLPYAVVVGLVGILLGDIPTAYGLSPYISIVLIFAVLTLILFFVGKKVE
jgi:Na+/H+ antiporter NhaC